EAEEINRLLFTPEGAETFAKILAGEIEVKPGSAWHDVVWYASQHPAATATILTAAIAGNAAMINSIAQGGRKQAENRKSPVVPGFVTPDTSYREDPVANSQNYQLVIEAQTKLKRMGAPIGRPDGVMLRKDGKSTLTQTFLRQLQEANGLPVTGLLDDETID